MNSEDCFKEIEDEHICDLTVKEKFEIVCCFALIVAVMIGILFTIITLMN